MGILAAMADQAATEGPGTEEAMAERGARAAMEDRELRWPWRVAPPKKFSWGSSPSQGGAQEPWKASWTGQRRERELDGTSGAKGELDGTSVGPGELDRTSGGPGKLDGTSGEA